MGPWPTLAMTLISSWVRIRMGCDSCRLSCRPWGGAAPAGRGQSPTVSSHPHPCNDGEMHPPSWLLDDNKRAELFTAARPAPADLVSDGPFQGGGHCVPGGGGRTKNKPGVSRRTLHLNAGLGVPQLLQPVHEPQLLPRDLAERQPQWVSFGSKGAPLTALSECGAPRCLRIQQRYTQHSPRSLGGWGGTSFLRYCSSRSKHSRMERKLVGVT